MTDLRKIARGKPCTVRIPAVCNYDSDTTVLAHIRMAGITGAGQKAPDLLGAWCCSNCHDAVDGRRQYDNYGHPFIFLEVSNAFLAGVMRTQYELIKLGIIKVGNDDER